MSVTSAFRAWSALGAGFMGLLGKILAILNVLAAIGFLVVAFMDYGKQRAWSTAVFQQELLARRPSCG